MKTATIPSLRVEPALREAAEELLREGESLSSFVERSIRDAVERRRMQQAFVARGLQAGEEARRTGRYVTPEAVLAKLEQRLAQAKKKRQP